MSRATSLSRYARWIERRWAALLERPVVFSPRDWDRITDWHERGVPLELVGECIEAASERIRSGRAKRPPRGLGYVANSVDEAWAVIVDGRRGSVDCVPADESRLPDGGGERASSHPALDPLRRLRNRLEAGTALRRLLDELLDDAEGGTPLEQIETRLELELAGATPPRLLAEVEAELDRELAPYRERMDAERIERTRSRARARRLRERLGLPPPACHPG